MIGLILFAYGAPESIDHLKEYYTHIRHGSAPSEQEMSATIRSYHRIGTADTLGAITKRQAAALAQLLQSRVGEEVRGYAGFKHTPPFVEDTVRQMVRDGVDRIVTMAMTPLNSRTGTMLYRKKVDQTLEQLNESIPVVHVENWHLHPLYLDVMTDRVKTAVQWLPEDARMNCTVIFTAHSQPGKLERHEIYATQFEELSEGVADRLRMPHVRFAKAYRSAGTKGEWLGPDVKEVIEDEARSGTKGIITCDLLSMTSNIEAVYDIGYDLQPICEEAGMILIRTEFPNDSFDFMHAVSCIIEENIAESNDFLLNGHNKSVS